MATNPVNFVDAIVVATQRRARNRTLVLRTGEVIAVQNEWCTVRVSSNDNTHVVSAGYHTFYRPRAGEIVDLLNDGDRWLVLGEQAGLSNYVQEPQVQFSGVEGISIAGTSATLPLTFPRLHVGTPAVMTNFLAGAGASLSFISRAINVSTSGFTAFLFSATGVSYTAATSFQWMSAGWFTSPPSIPAPLEGRELEPGFHYATLTCHTPGCLRADVPVPRIILPDEEPEGYLTPRCGQCSQDIVDIVH